jgi:hypothetical protein
MPTMKPLPVRWKAPSYEGNDAHDLWEEMERELLGEAGSPPQKQQQSESLLGATLTRQERTALEADVRERQRRRQKDEQEASRVRRIERQDKAAASARSRARVATPHIGAHSLGAVRRVGNEVVSEVQAKPSMASTTTSAAPAADRAPSMRRRGHEAIIY